MADEKISIFYSYSHKDEYHREDLETHLAMLRREGIIHEWHDRKIVAGGDIDNEVDINLEQADIVLLLVSPDFLASDYCWKKEMTFALERHESGSTTVIPVIVRPVDWKPSPFSKLKALPRDGKPVTTWDNKDLAWLNVATGLRDAIKNVAEKKRRFKQKSGFISIKQALTRGVDVIDTSFRSDSAITGLATGFVEVDDRTGGLQRGDLIIVAGRPSMGKSSFVTNIAENVAIGFKLPVAIFSAEMSSTQLSMRMMASIGRINGHAIRTGRMQDDDWPRLTSAIGMLAETNIYINDGRMLDLTGIRAQAIELQKEHGLALIVIDSLTLFSSTSSGKTQSDLSYITRSLKNLALELNIPIVATANVMRLVEKRVNKRPILSDVDQSLDVEQYADVVLILYRDEVYNEDSADRGTAEIFIAKQRSGPIGASRLVFLSEYGRFENIAKKL